MPHPPHRHRLFTFGVALGLSLAGAGIGGLVGLTAQAANFDEDAFLVADLRPGSAGSSPGQVTRLGSGPRVVFAATGAAGRELWRSAGTPATTVRIADLRAGAASSSPTDLVRHGGRVFFTAETGAAGRELWVTDGSASGTRMVRDLNPGASSSDPASLVSASGLLWFTATEPSRGRELWSTDGTSSGTRRVKDLMDGSASSSPEDLVVLDGSLVFSADDEDRGRELWKVHLGTRMVSVVYDLSGGESDPDELVRAGTEIFFTADDELGRRGLYRTDGVSTQRVEDEVLGEDPRPTGLTQFGQSVFFSASGPGGAEPWVSDGTPLNTHLLADIRLGSADSGVREAVAFDGRVFFTADSYENPGAVWVTDGSPEGTTLFLDTGPGSTSAAARDFTVLGARLYFVTTDSFGEQLWSTDGTAEGSERVRGLASKDLSSPENLGAVGGSLVFSATGGGRGRELYSVTPVVTITALAKPAKRPRAGRAFAMKVAVSGGAVPPDGRITLTSRGRVVGKGKVVDGVGSARVGRGLPAGKHMVRATFGGSWDGARSVSSGTVVRVTR